MLVNFFEEVRNIYPTSRLTSIDNLRSLFEQVERSTIQNVLGLSLLKKIKEDYDELNSEYGGIWADRIENPDDRVFIIRTVQAVEVYYALANNVGILSSSLNQAGGFNQASSQNYEELSDDVRKDLKLDLFNGARRSLEELLSLLEADARGERIYTDLWKESTYFYMSSTLLFPTAVSVHPFYINLGETYHSKFISIMGNIADRQERSLGLRVGQSIMDDLKTIAHGGHLCPVPNGSDGGEDVAREDDNNVEPVEPSADAEDADSGEPQDTELFEQGEQSSDSNAESVDVNADNEVTEGDVQQESEQVQSEEEKQELLRRRELVLKKALPSFLRSLAFFVMADLITDEKQYKRVETYEANAEKHLNIACSFIVKNPDLFHDELATDMAKDYKDFYHKDIDAPSFEEMTEKERQKAMLDKRRRLHDTIFVMGSCF